MLWFAVFLLWWNDRVDTFVFEKFEVLAVCITGVGCNHRYCLTDITLDAFQLLNQLLAFALFASGNIHINDNAKGIVNSSVLLVGRLHAIRIA